MKTRKINFIDEILDPPARTVNNAAKPANSTSDATLSTLLWVLILLVVFKIFFLVGTLWARDPFVAVFFGVILSIIFGSIFVAPSGGYVRSDRNRPGSCSTACSDPYDPDDDLYPFLQDGPFEGGDYDLVNGFGVYARDDYNDDF